MNNPVIFENIKAYKRRTMNDHDAYGGDYNIEVQADGKKARVKSNDYFLQSINQGVSRLNKLNRNGQIGNDAHCYMTVNGDLVFFNLPDFHTLINL
jgi:hypothetical protein